MPGSSSATTAAPPRVVPSRETRTQFIVEIVSDSGEGAQKAGQAFAAVSARSGNGVWTVEIIPAEIKPPARSQAGASGIRVRIGTEDVTNMGDHADMVVAFNEQVLFGRIRQDAYRPGTILLLENKWATDPDESIRESYAQALADFRDRGFVVHELPLEQECLAFTDQPRVGKNMFVLGMLCEILGRSLDEALAEVEHLFGKKGETVVHINQELLRGGYAFAQRTLSERYAVPPVPTERDLVVMNGNQAVGLGIMASGMEVVAMYPITPATSASHFLAGTFDKVGGFMHQAEDEIAAIGFAIGASYAGKTACTITSGPGLALKTEFIGLAVMAEIPLVIVVVQRGGPSTGLPTKVEQGDLLAALYGQPGDTPKIVLAPSTIEECFHFVVTARRLAEAFRTPVIVLTDANLATGVQPFERPRISSEWLANPVDRVPWDASVPPFDWDEETGLSPRPVPGRPGGTFTLTGLAHDRKGKVAYDPEINQAGCEMRSRKLAALFRALETPPIYGDEEGELLIVGWGSTWGAIQEAVKRARDEGVSVSMVHLKSLSPLPPGLADMFTRFRRVMTIEINYSDPPSAPLIGPENRRMAQLAWLLRASTLAPVDCWSNVYGQPLRPGEVYAEIMRRVGRKAEVNQ